MRQRIALLRGINVGRAKRIAMADLRDLIEDLGFFDVRTMLNSGNALFRTARRSNRRIAADLEAAINERFGFEVRVVVVSSEELDLIVDEDSLARNGGDPARHLVAFLADGAALDKAEALLGETWEPEAIALGSRAAYLWCPDGIIQSKLLKAFSRATGEASTTRNWATVLKLQQAMAYPRR